MDTTSDSQLTNAKPPIALPPTNALPTTQQPTIVQPNALHTIVQPKPPLSLVPYLLFWERINRAWHLLYPQFMTGNREVLNTVNAYLGTLSPNLEIAYSYNEINCQQLESHKGLVSFYISPKLKRENIPFMQKLYTTRCTLPNLLVLKYRPYHENNDVPTGVELDDVTLSYDDVGYHHNFGFNEEKKLSMNIVITVPRIIADKFLEKKKIVFKGPTSESSRDVWMTKDGSINPIDVYLLEILGEYNLMHNVGYIEILPRHDPLFDPAVEFNQLEDMRSTIKIITNSYKKCAYCGHNELQTDLFSHGDHLYCSQLCLSSRPVSPLLKPVLDIQ